MKRVVIDTNGYLRLLLDDLPTQANQVESILKRASKRKIEVFLPQIVIFEVIFALEKYYRLAKEEVSQKAESLVSIRYIEVESREIFIHALDIYKKSNNSFVDCFLVSASTVKDAELFTFDENLKKHPSKQILGDI